MLLVNAISYPFKGGGWFGKLFRVGFSILLLAPPFGYAVRVAQAVSDGQEHKLPTTNAFGDFGRGIQILVAWVLYAIPGILLIRALTPPASPTNLFSLNIDFTGIVLQNVKSWLIALPFSLAFLVGFVRFITTDSFAQIFNIPENLKYLQSNFAVLLSHFVQAYLVTLIFQLIGGFLVFTICGFFISYGLVFIVWGYTIGTLARALNLSWKGGKSQITFE